MAFSIWRQFESEITHEPALTLRGYLADPTAIVDAKKAGIVVPTGEDFKRDPAFNPNPHALKLPTEYLEMAFLVRTLAVWGWQPLVCSAVLASNIQLKARATLHDEIQHACIAAATSASTFLQEPTENNRNEARIRADACSQYFKQHEENPDTPEAGALWLRLGACWFAAEAAAQDHSLAEWDGPGPAQGNVVWGNRNSVWPTRAVEAACEIDSYSSVLEQIKNGLIEWTRRLKS